MLQVAVITVSDRAFNKEYEDRSGKRIEELLHEAYPDIKTARKIIPDEKHEIVNALEEYASFDWIITTGGTGISPRDVTPEATQEYCDKALPGIAEILRHESYKETPFSMLSRGYAGAKGNTIIVNFPGSSKAVELCTRCILPLLKHGQEMFKGRGHEHGKNEK